MDKFDSTRARLKGPDYFMRFSIDSAPELLKSLGQNGDTELIVFEHKGSRYGFLLLQLSYHHVAQGSIDGFDFIITFCGICNSAMGFKPILDDSIYHFSAGGLYNGLLILIDDETQTYWDHITGEAIYGSLEGEKLSPFSLSITNVRTELSLENPAKIWVSKPSLFGRFFSFMTGRKSNSKGFFPPGFRKTMADVDKRLPELSVGLGVIINNEARFYPKDCLENPIEDELGGEKIGISIYENGIPRANFKDGKYPVQLFSRWYGFVLTYPNCGVFG